MKSTYMCRGQRTRGFLPRHLTLKGLKKEKIDELKGKKRGRTANAMAEKRKLSLRCRDRQGTFHAGKLSKGSSKESPQKTRGKTDGKS